MIADNELEIVSKELFPDYLLVKREAEEMEYKKWLQTVDNIHAFKARRAKVKKTNK